MATKLKAVAVARDAGCRVVIADGREERVISRVLSGEIIGTLFDAAHGLKNRQRWIKNSRPQGSIAVDEGALAAIRAKKSLLPRGVASVVGRFDRGDVVLVEGPVRANGAAKIVTSLSSDELERVIGLKSGEIEAILGPGSAKIVARPEETVFLEDYAG